MADGQAEQLRHLLAESAAGQPQALEKLTDTVYQQLRQMAENHFRARFGTERGLTWQPTTLLNETLMRVIRQRQPYDSEGHFFAIVTTIMKRVLLDYVRERRAQKRGARVGKVEFDPERHSPIDPADAGELDLESLFAAIDRLEALDPRKADVARMRVVWGMSVSQIAESLGVSVATVERDWSMTRAWLCRELSENNPPD
jgi:RNA polymerase sigma-70 factor, ECF subfamily